MLESTESPRIADETFDRSAAERKEWEAPALTVFGDVTAVTRQMGTTLRDGPGSASS